MAKIIEYNYFPGLKTKRLLSITYELKCIKEANDEFKYKELIKIGEIYTCTNMLARNWDKVYLVEIGGGAIEVPKDYFEPLP